MSSADDEGRLEAEAQEAAADPVDQAPDTGEDAPAADAAPSDTEGTGADAEIAQQEPAPEATASTDDAPAEAPAEGDTAATPDQPVGEASDPAPDAAEVPTPEPAPHDDDRTPLVELLQSELGEDAVLDQWLVAGRDVVVRVAVERWADAARALRDKAGMTYFCFLSAIDWLPSPFGKSEGDPEPPPPPASSADLAHGVTGGATRFQLLARLERPMSGIGITLKADVDDTALSAPTWTGVFSGADWHEREAHEMFGITFDGHPYLANLYLPGGFEGYPLRKDFPLLSRLVKPWPGLVDVEPMPGEPDEEEASEEVSS